MVDNLTGPLADVATTVLKRADAVCMSSDESGREDGVRVNRKEMHHRQYRVIPKPWRASSLVEFFKWLDYRAEGGSTRVRVPASTVASSTRFPPAGLPRNWYDETWLASLAPKKREALHPAVSFSLDILQGLLSLPETAAMRRHQWDDDEYDFPKL